MKILHNLTIDGNVNANNLGGSSSNPNVVSVTTEAALYNASNNGKILEIQSDITLTDDRTLASDIILIDGGGSITLDGYDLEGVNTKIVFLSDKMFIDAKTGTLSGSWIPPSTFNQKNLGAIGDGFQLDDVNITSGNNIVTSASGLFTSNMVGQTISIVGAGANALGSEPQNQSHTSTITGYTNSTTVTIADNAINTVSGDYARIGTDNYNVILQCAYLRNQQGGTLEFVGKDEVFLTTLELTEVAYTDAPVGWVLGNGTDNVKWEGKGAIIQLFPHDINKTKVVRYQLTKNSSIKNMIFLGDYDIYPSENGKNESNHCIVAWTLAEDCVTEGNTIEYFYGDGYIGGGNTQFVNYLQGDNVATIQDSDWSVGNIDDSGTIDGGDTDFVYSTTLVPLTTYQFENSRDIDGKKFYQLTGGSFSGWAGMLTPYYYALYYDGSGTFIEKSEKQRIYDKIYIDKEEWVQIRILIDAPVDKEELDLRVRPVLFSFGEKIINNNFRRCGRQGISNVGYNALIDNNVFENIGGLAAGPGYGIDLEDNHGITQNVTISNNIFRNNWGDIKLISVYNVNIFGNKLLTNTRDLNAEGAPTTSNHAGIISSYGRNVIVSNNQIYGKSVSLDRQDLFIGNKMNGGQISYSANANIIKDNVLRDVVFYGDGIDPDIDRLGYPTIIEGNDCRYNQANTSYIFRDPQLVGLFRNNKFRFNDISDWSYEATDSSVNLTSGTDILFFYQATMTADYGGGFMGGNEITGILPSSGSRDYTSAMTIPVMDMEGENIFYHPIKFQKGLPQDRTIDGLKIKNGWLEFALDQFENSIVSATPTLTFNNAEITVTTDYPWTNTNARCLTTVAKNVNLVFNDLKIDLQQTSSVIGSSNRFIKFAQLGTLIFNRPDWSSASSKTLDFTSTFIIPSGTGDILIVDPVRLNNLTITLRSGDHIVFTKPNPLMDTYATFADESAASSAGYPSGYMYKTSTGELRIKL